MNYPRDALDRKDKSAKKDCFIGLPVFICRSG